MDSNIVAPHEKSLTHFCVQLADTLDQREVEYGNASEHFADVAKLWGVILKRDIAPHQVALCLDALKTARLINNPLHADSWLDKAGYAALGGTLGDKK